MTLLYTLTQEMINYYSGDAKRIQHFLKVHSFAKLIGEGENLPTERLEILETAAIVHDIGIKVSEEKYGSCNGKYQEIEGPSIAKDLLNRLGFSNDIIERVCYLIGHHHTYDNIDGIDYQILVEADFLVNIYEDNLSKDAILSVYNKIFKTKTGKVLLETIFKLGNKR